MHELLASAHEGEPPMRHSTDDFVTGGRRRRTRRRMTWVGSAAGTVLAMAAVTFVPQMIVGNRTVPASGRPVMFYAVTAFNQSISAFEVSDIEVSDPVNVTPGYQQSAIRRVGEATRYERGDGLTEQVPKSESVLTVYRPGVFDPARFGDAESVAVGSEAGRYSADERSLAWQYAPGAWAVIHSGQGHLSKADMLRLAAAMRTTPDRPATLPWRMTYLPAGYHLSSMGTNPDFAVTGDQLQRGAARFTKEPEEYASLTQPLTGDGLSNLRVTVYPRWVAESQLTGFLWAGAQADPSGGPSFDPSPGVSDWPSYEPSYEPSFEPSHWPTYEPSHTPPSATDVEPFCVPDQSVCYRVTADGAYVVEATATAEPDGTELLKVLRGMRIADPDDTSTWSVLGEALPATSG
ncbi:hypothetical protein [Actinoplanes sichuanensis]|uniref:Uncharacterized protein n=1 Tax=Actinoplanes sichuanensis TaxID=512349 RepID=A0ABW4AQ65_9ACTN|nr:hypothetical protein [Actinoplanes sichuanensis]